MARTAVYSITIDGTDVSSNFHPLLISLAVDLYDGGQADTVEIELDDTGGQISLPRVGASLSVSLGWSDTGAATIFDGFTDEPKSHAKHHRPGGEHTEAGDVGQITSAGSRSRGRTLTLSGKSANMGGKVKMRQQDHLDNGTLGDAAKKWGAAAGLDVVLSDALASVQRPYWHIGNESFMAWGVRVARENGATFKISGTHASFTPLAGGASASGAALEGITAAWGSNLIDWSITPVQSRPLFSSFAARWYDPVKAAWKTEKVDGPQDAIDAAGPPHVALFKAASADIARYQAMSNAAAAANEKGAGDHVVIDGEPAAQPEASCTVAGVRTGVDGSFTIAKVRHDLRRSSGYTTTLGLKRPTGAAGVDTREPGSPAAVAAPAAADVTPVVTPAGSGGIGSA